MYGPTEGFAQCALHDHMIDHHQRCGVRVAHKSASGAYRSDEKNGRDAQGWGHTRDI
ncbi:hypothetical protein PILCRDRAFT_828581 [Piloderma croceum F 1598]|uniref:Uncharacterized protein n=1 Tax=Piloderma croceum (strain F 1598) TaxID=765440 RepID=A0A0C3F1P2_PILCF|nr:hypothetical protein PILCRDRAFT_828581 [Piloderma croceum F 1598]